MNNLQKALLVAVGGGVAICVVPVAGAIIGASLAANGLAGGIAGFTLGALALPVPIAILQSRKPEEGKNRLQRIGSALGGLYGAVFKASGGVVKSTFSPLLPKKKRDNTAPKSLSRTK
ncbi:MAG: hypothetical protein EPN97_10030 [Alphaproteobacteria bacterium]|nr:MAG: hypothetical protein EPN97_10030 [Alphaproteobacteria bacterium]